MPAITTNIAANSAVRYLNINSNQETSALSKLSSGSRHHLGFRRRRRASRFRPAFRPTSPRCSRAATNAAQANAILQTADGGASNHQRHPGPHEVAGLRKSASGHHGR